MSGHSKWATIKHKKAATDAKRGKIFSKIAREIMVAARAGGGDLSGNPTLRALVQKGRAVNMPGDNIDRAIKKGTGALEGMQFEEIIYEGYAPGGVALIVEVLTDNKNRTAAEVRHAFNRHGANFAGTGSVMRTFKRKGQIFVKASAAPEDKLMELVLEAGAEDMTTDADGYEIVTEPAAFMPVCDALEKAGIHVEESEIKMIPDVSVPVADKNQAASLLRFVETLEDMDDVKNVYANFEIDDALMEQISG